MELPVGFCGIIKFTIQIIHRNLKHFLCIAFILLLPSSVLLAITPSRTSVAQIIAQTISQYPSANGGIPSPSDGGISSPSGMTTLPAPPYPLFTAILGISFFFGLVTQPLLTFSVCRAVFNKSLACKSSLLSVPRSGLNLIVTRLCVAGMLLGLYVGMLILMIIMAAGLWAMSIDMTIVSPIVMLIWGVVVAGGAIYVGIAWSLASTVAILEEKRGWEAVKRSTYLLDGSKCVVLSLTVVFGVCLMFLPISVADEASVMWRWSCVVLSLALQGMVGLLSASSTVVLYLSCKSRLKEPLDTLIALSPQFGPPETSAKYMDIETALFDTV